MFLVLERDSINLRMSISIFSATCFLDSSFFCVIKALAGDYEAFEIEFKDMSLDCFIFWCSWDALTGYFGYELTLCLG